MFGLTSEERKVAIFLSAMALIGMGVNFFAKANLKPKDICGFSLGLGKIDLNAADAEMLASVTGIGEKLARRILEYRQEHSGFSEIEELKNIKGLNDYRYEKIKDAFVIKK
jgi:competence ComEA-like helix-hairpin-helix protein